LCELAGHKMICSRSQWRIVSIISYHITSYHHISDNYWHKPECHPAAEFPSTLTLRESSWHWQCRTLHTHTHTHNSWQHHNVSQCTGPQSWDKLAIFLI